MAAVNGKNRVNERREALKAIEKQNTQEKKEGKEVLMMQCG